MDHLVALARDLDRAIGDYERLGFPVTPGGEHADGLTRSALVPFEDGSYLELVAFLDSDDPRQRVGMAAVCRSRRGTDRTASDDLQVDAERLEEGGLAVNGPDDGGRRFPDGAGIRWRSARIRQESGRALPFLKEDLTPRGHAYPEDRPPSTRTARRA